MMVSTVLITYKLYSINKKFQQRSNIPTTSSHQNVELQLLNNSNNNENSSINNKLSSRKAHKNDIAEKRAKKNNQIYKLLISVNVFFFLLVTPVVLTNSLGWLREENKIVIELVYIMAYLNHCLNFIFYGLEFIKQL